MTVPARRVDSAAPLALRMTQRYTAMHDFAKGGGWVMGARMPTRVGILAITFSEDLSITAPDFTIGVAWTPSRP